MVRRANGSAALRSIVGFVEARLGWIGMLVVGEMIDGDVRGLCCLGLRRVGEGDDWVC